MKSRSTFVTVVAALIRDRWGRMLLQQALAHKRHGGQWEFPGGKVENGEIPRLALRREVGEELSLDLAATAMEPACFAEEPPCDGRPGIVLLLYNCREWHGEPEAREGQKWGWFTRAEAGALDLAAMDRALFERLPA